MAWDDREKEEITLDEGKLLTAYKDTEGNWTVGIGHELPPGPWQGHTITEEECSELFEEDFENAVKGAQAAFPAFDGLDGPRKGALCNMAFQLGGPTLQSFHTFLNYLDMGRYQDAALDLMRTKYAKQVPARASRIAYRIQTGLYKQR